MIKRGSSYFLSGEALGSFCHIHTYIQGRAIAWHSKTITHIPQQAAFLELRVSRSLE